VLAADSTPPIWLADNVARVRDDLASAAIRAGRQPDEVRLVAVSKTKPAALISAAARLGVRDFGENRVQEAADKIPLVNAALPSPPTWHLVGTLQTNKVKAALSLFAILHAVDSLKLAEAINRRVEGAAALPVLLEVYLGSDPARPGFRPGDLAEAVERIAGLERLRVSGLMTVAPLGVSERDTRACFAEVRGLRDRLAARFPECDLRELSMGMSEDYPLAVAEGSTMVRIGRALFGERP
jgi:pyridoxal phosphate enzyme (YggS family)